MNLEKLKAEHPEIYKAAVSEGMAKSTKDAIAKERDKVNALLVYGENSGDMETAVKAIKEGSEITQELIANFSMKAINNKEIQNTQEDSDSSDPGKVKTSDKDTEAQTVMNLVAEKIGFEEVE